MFFVASKRITETEGDAGSLGPNVGILGGEVVLRWGLQGGCEMMRAWIGGDES